MAETVHGVEVEKVRPTAFRYSRVGPPMDAKLAYVLSRRGQTRPVLVREIRDAGRFSHYEIIDGHRVYDAMRANGAKTCTVVSVGVVDDLEARLISMEHNESRGPVDHVALARAFKSLSDSGRYPASEVAARIDFDEEQVSLYSKLLDFDVAQFSRGPDSAIVTKRVARKRSESGDQRTPVRAGNRAHLISLMRQGVLRGLKGVKLSVFVAYCFAAGSDGWAKIRLEPPKKRKTGSRSPQPLSLVEITGRSKNTLTTIRAALVREGFLIPESAVQAKGPRGRFAEEWYFPQIIPTQGAPPLRRGGPSARAASLRLEEEEQDLLSIERLGPAAPLPEKDVADEMDSDILFR